MNRLARLTQLAGLNAVPVVGVVWAGWSDGTALALYWCETLMMILLVTARIHIHRKATNKRGHYVEVKVTTTTNGRKKVGQKVGLFGTSFLVFALLLSFGQLLLLQYALGDSLSINRHALEQGVEAAALFLTLGFLIDLAGMRRRSFAWIRNMSMGALWRVFLVQVAIIAGVIATGMFHLPRTTLIVFVVLKLWTDMASQLPQYNPDQAPAWTERLMGDGFRAYWSAQTEAEKAREAQEEERFNGRPMPFASSLIQRSDG